MKIERLPSGSYHTRIYLGEVNGKKKFKSITAPTAKEVKALVAEYTILHTEPLVKTDMTVRQAAEQLVAERSATWSITYKAHINSVLRVRFLDLQNKKISELDRPILQEAINAELQAKTRSGKITPKCVKDAFQFYLSAIRNVNKNIDDMSAYRFPIISDFKYHTPDAEQMKKIFAAVKGTDVELPVLLAATMSLRTSEIRGLKWGDIKKDTLYITRAVVGTKAEKAPKTAKSARPIPLSPPVAECLAKMKRGADDEYVYPCYQNAIRKRFYSACRKAGIKPCRVHELRHAFASNALAVGVPEKYIMAIGGWSSPTVLRAVYQQTFPAETAAAIAKISEKMTGS